ncbi:MAG TPA: excinuclease ABC subunit UvrA, partial [Polyangiaceae bacterium]|nr:excinuclease ABC subunit UvrA [Polyangiaceae bacterium]
MTSPRREPDSITVRGAREHNLKNVSLAIPKKKLVVLTGVSGSGKSSLAFDTLYAEGQRRYVESLSSYARQFLGQMEKPKYDTIRGLSPTISIEQKTASNNPRSTVGTVTEVHDYLRVLFASIGLQHCHGCGKRATAQSAQQIVNAISAYPRGTDLMIFAPLERQRKGEHRERLADLKSRGFTRVRVDGRVIRLEELSALDKKAKHDLDLVVDRLTLQPDHAARLADSVESALREGGGSVIAAASGAERTFTERAACADCGLSFPELSPLSFSFNSPLGFCAECNGLGARPEMDPELVVQDPKLSIREGAISVWTSGTMSGDGWIAATVEWVAETFKIDLDKPWCKLGAAQRDLVLFGGKRNREEWEGLCNQLMRRLRQTESEDMKAYYLRFFSTKACPACKGGRLRPESRAVTIQGKSIDALSSLRIAQAAEWVRDLGLSGADAEIAHELRKEIGARLGFLVNVGLGYLTLDRAAASLSGGESQRIRLASQIGSELTGVIYILDEPSIGLHQRDNDKLLATLKALRDVGNSVIVVEHDEETMRAADYLIDFGPGAGELGGQVVAQGTVEQVMKSRDSITGAYLSGRRSFALPGERRAGNGKFLEVKGATEHNLRGVDVRFPLGNFIA